MKLKNKYMLLLLNNSSKLIAFNLYKNVCSYFLIKLD